MQQNELLNTMLKLLITVLTKLVVTNPAASFGMKIDSVSIRISPVHSDRL